MPRFAASSTWSFGFSMAGFSPQSLISGLAVSSAPTGHSRCGRLGMFISRGGEPGCIFLRDTVQFPDAVPDFAHARFNGGSVFPFFLSMPICLEVALRSDCRACFSVSALRRASSQARTSSTSFHASPLRGFSRAFTSSGFSRITRMSSITRTACTPSPRHAKPNERPSMEKRYPFTEKRCAQRHAFPNAAPFRKLPFFPCQTMIFFLLRKNRTAGGPDSPCFRESWTSGARVHYRKDREGISPVPTGGVPFITICS